MDLMALDSDKDREAIVSLPGYNGNWLVITDGIEIVGDSGSQRFFSKPGGKQVYFIRLASKIGLRQSDTPGNYTIVIYHREYYSRDSVVDKHDVCACKLPGECYGVCKIALLVLKRVKRSLSTVKVKFAPYKGQKHMGKKKLLEELL